MSEDQKPPLHARLIEVRRTLEKGFSAETAVPGSTEDTTSAGQCAAVAVVTRELLGGDFVSAEVAGHSHWFNRLRAGPQLVDVDLTGDQFGYREVQIASANDLYPDTRLRSMEDVAEETLQRAIQLAERAGLTTLAHRLREWLKAKTRPLDSLD